MAPGTQVKQQEDFNKVWNAERVAECARQLEQYGEAPGGNPFHEKDPNWRAADIVYEYSEAELIEIAKCANDVVYFANRYCMAMTDSGVQRITLRPYQEKVLKSFQENRFNVFLASRQIGKTVTASIFITWYLLFNYDKNVIVLANKAATAAEILDKIKAVIKGLPFFLKPGIKQNNVMTIRLDNDCRVMGQATTKTAAIGFTLHLVYMDEFAHIQSNFLEPFYRSVYPTISSSQISRVIITSTPNGRNKFYEIYQGAVEGKNEYKPMRVDWWEVPGRDDAWKAREIANLGSEELFNQEYGNQFLASERLLLGGDALRAMKKMVKNYTWKEIQEFDDDEIDYENLKWHPDFSLYDIDKKHDRFVFSVDIADGSGKDFSIINIFKVTTLSAAAIRKMKNDRVENESSLFRLQQIGLFRSNTAGADDLAKVCGILLFKVFEAENVKIALEINFKGDLFIEKLQRNEKYYDEIFLHTKHNQNTQRLSIGIKLHGHNKMFFCRDFRKLVLEKRIVLNEKLTFDEMNDFGINSRGSYSSQSGHDDIAMTCVNLVPLLYSYAFEELIEDMYENMELEIKERIQKKISQTDSGGDDTSFSYLFGKDK